MVVVVWVNLWLAVPAAAVISGTADSVLLAPDTAFGLPVKGMLTVCLLTDLMDRYMTRTAHALCLLHAVVYNHAWAGS